MLRFHCCEALNGNLKYSHAASSAPGLGISSEVFTGAYRPDGTEDPDLKAKLRLGKRFRGRQAL